MFGLLCCFICCSAQLRNRQNLECHRVGGSSRWDTLGGFGGLSCHASQRLRSSQCAGDEPVRAEGVREVPIACRVHLAIKLGVLVALRYGITDEVFAAGGYACCGTDGWLHWRAADLSELWAALA